MMSPLIRLACSRLLVAIAIALIAAASRASTNSSWSLRVWQSDDGLPNNIVTSLAQTRDGFLWAATPVRLARFDGVHFDEFASKSVVPDRTEYISQLMVSHSGRLWIAMDHGPVACIGSGTTSIYTDKLQWQRERPTDGTGVTTVFTNQLPDQDAQSLTEDAEGGVWATYRGGSVCRIKDGEVVLFTAREGLPSGPSSLALDNKGMFWFAKGGQVGVFRNGRFNTLTVAGGPSRPVRIARASAGGVWICAGAQLYKYDEGGVLEKVGAFSPEDPGADPTSLLEDRAGAVWIGTSSSGLFRCDQSGFETVPTSHREILSLLEDAEGNIWAGTGGGGLDQIRPKAVTLEGLSAGLPFEALQSVCEDTNGVVWGVTQNFLLVCRTNGAWITVSTNSNWPGGRPMCVAADREGCVWIATEDHALHCLREGSYTSWRLPSGLTGHIIHSLLIDSKGGLWIGQGAPESLQCLRAGRFDNFQLPPHLGTLRAMAEDAAGNIWVGTSRGSLLRVSGNVVTDETARTVGLPLSVRCLCATPDGGLWVGYAGGGLGWFKNDRFFRVGMDQGMHDYYLSQIIADGRGWLWFGADHGLFKVRQEDLEAAAMNKALRVKPIVYGRDAGLPSLQANFGETPGTLRSRDGRLWMPMRTALAVVDPAQLHEDPVPPQVIIKRVLVDGQVAGIYSSIRPVRDMVNLQAPEAGLRLPPGHRRLEFEFTAPSFAAPENVQFRYRLEGFDEGWIDAGPERTASYSRLPAGEYHFQVKACNGDGVWNEAGTAVGFAVTPFFWQRWWFRLAVLAAFTSVVAATARYASLRRLRLKLQALEQAAALDHERARIAKDIHDDLGGSLTQVELLLELAMQDSGESANVKDRVRQVSTAVRAVGEALDEIVWAVNPRNDTLPDLIDFLSQFAVEFLHTAGIRCRVDLPEDPPPQPLTPEVRHHLFLVLKEALNNIARHAGASEVRLQITVNETSMGLVIEDNGRGFEGVPNDAGADGLRNMCQRMKEIGGGCDIKGKPGSGTRVTLALPWPAAR
jgi:signal transduction histidine kinase/ligand-binding sensor domain-containing protein